MIIYQPEVAVINGWAVLFAKVEFEKTKMDKPDRAWFSFPEKFLPCISNRVEAFASAFTPVAMAVNENLQLDSPLSPQLALGLREYQLALKNWYPRQMQVVTIRASAYESLPAAQAGKSCVTVFSGGVDSSFTLRSHLPDRQPLSDFQVKQGIFVHGFDIPLQNQQRYDAYLREFSDRLWSDGVQIIPCRTNLHYFSSGLLSWGIAHGGILTGVGLALDKLIRYYLIPSSYSFGELVPWGSTPMTDHWLSTETMKVIHHGMTISRIEKIEGIADWEPAHQFLRVCVNESKLQGVENCSHCEKCLRTMTMLEICGVLKNFKTFKQPFGWRQIINWLPLYNAGEVWLPATIQYARSKRRRKILLLLYIVHLRGKIRGGIRRLVPWPIFQWLKRKYFPYEKDLYHPVNLE